MRKVMETSKFFEILPREQPRNFHKKYPQINYMLTVQSVFTTMQFTDRFSSTREILWKPQNCFEFHYGVQPGNFLAKIRPTSINNFINVPPILTNSIPIDLARQMKVNDNLKIFFNSSQESDRIFFM